MHLMRTSVTLRFDSDVVRAEQRNDTFTDDSDEVSDLRLNDLIVGFSSSTLGLSSPLALCIDFGLPTPALNCCD